jgi:CHAT domain-containing protein
VAAGIDSTGAANSGDIRLTSDEIDFVGGANSVLGAGTLSLQPLTPGQNLNLAGNEGTAGLDITTVDLAAFDGFSNVLLQPSGNGSLTVVNPVTFNNPTTLEANAIAINGAITGNAAITLTGATTLNAGITTANQNITLNGNVLLGNPLALNTGGGGGNILVNGTVNGGQDLTLTAGNGNITLNGALGNNTPLGNFLVTSANNVTTNAIAASSITQAAGTGTTTTNGTLETTAPAGIDLNGTNFTINSPVVTQNGGNLTITNTGNLAIASNLSLDGGFTQDGDGDVSLAGNIATNNQDIRFTGALSLAGNAAFDVGGATLEFGALAAGGNALTLRAGEINFTGGADSVSGTGDLSLQPATANQGIEIGGAGDTAALDLTADDIAALANGFAAIAIGRDDGSGAITIRNPVSFADPVQIISPVGTGTIAATGTITGEDDASITLRANQDVTAGDITANAGITLISHTGAVLSGNLDTSGTTTDGGNITVQARDRITTGAIDSSAQTGNGGNVTLDPENDIQVTSINAQGGTNGVGGTVDATTESFFRATGTFTDQNGIEASISSAGGVGGGAITVRHGGNGITPFIVGDATTNGTAGAMTSRADNTIAPVRSFRDTFRQDDIGIITEFSPLPSDDIPPPETILETDNPPSQDAPQAELPEVTIDTVVSQWEETFTREFETYLGLPETAIKSLDDARNTLRRIEDATGVKPALIYAVFSPQTAPGLIQTSDAQNPNDGLELILVTADDPPIRKRVEGAVRQKVIPVSETFRREITTITSRPNTYLPPAQQMYRWLLAPLEADLQAREIDNLVYIADTGLRTAPLAALHDGRGFIIERYSVGLMPSLSLTDTRYADIRDAQVLAMGASRFEEKKNLAAVPVELSAITANLWLGKSLLDERFTLENLKAQRQRNPFGIVHLATHATFEPGEPSHSYIQLWDTKLRLNQLRQLDWNDPTVQLLVLSACKTAQGSETVELGFAGLAVQAGVQSALASLWFVSDEGALALMANFYEELKAAPIKAEALRRAQVAMLNGEVRLEEGNLITPERTIPLPPELTDLGSQNLSHPKFWAAFTLIGNPW